VTGKKIAFYHITDDQLLDGLKASGSPPAIQAEISQMLFVQRDHGCAFCQIYLVNAELKCATQTTVDATSSRVASTSLGRRRPGANSASPPTGRRC
jgi:hypothetical protein